MPSELLSSISGGGAGGAYPFPTLPTPLTNDGYESGVSNRVPHNGTLVDNIQMPSTATASGTGAIVGLLADVTVWTVNPTDINAACDYFLCIQTPWYDSVNDRLYVFALDAATTPDTLYTAYITLETGAVTNVGNVQLGTQPTSVTTNGKCNISRAAIDSGNFTLKFSDRTVVINESTGAEVSNVAATNISDSTVDPGTYTSLDGSVLLDWVTENTGSTSGTVTLTKDGKTVYVPHPSPLVAVFGATFLPWGDKVKALRDVNTGTGNGTLRTFNRAQFDLWLDDVAKLGGIA